jgi:hypothetical protein
MGRSLAVGVIKEHLQSRAVPSTISLHSMAMDYSRPLDPSKARPIQTQHRRCLSEHFATTL